MKSYTEYTRKKTQNTNKSKSIKADMPANASRSKLTAKKLITSHISLLDKIHLLFVSVVPIPTCY